jgi:hypothetical protein
MLDNEALMNKGAEAEQAWEYVSQLVESAKEQMFDRIMALAPDQTLHFTILKAQLQALDDVILVLEADIANGKGAIQRIQGETSQKAGIL